MGSYVCGISHNQRKVQGILTIDARVSHRINPTALGTESGFSCVNKMFDSNKTFGCVHAEKITELALRDTQAPVENKFS